nr:probable kinetochore protein ndc80 [Onthophagus taurus]
MDRSPTFHQSVVNSGSRQSRIPVKDSQRKSRFSRSSSNAIRRVPSSSHLAVPQNYRNVRSKSCVNLQDLCATPLTSCSSSSIRTPLSSGSKYSVINTEFLTSQFSRVKKYFRNKDPTIQTLKPLTMAVYVQTMKILWNEIDPRIEIDPKKIDAIGEYLKLFKFPSQIKMSVLKAPTVPHNFQYILSIWVWLLDEIEAIHKILDAEQSNKHRIGFKFFMGRFKDMSDKNGGSEKITETFRQSCKEYLYKENKLRMQSYEECQQIEKKVRRDLQEATEKNVTLKTRLNEIQAKNREIELRNTVAINERDRLERDEEVLQNKYLNSLEEEKQLKKALNDQPCSLEEWKKIVEEHTLLSFELELKSKQENENKEQSSQIDMELMDVKCKIINVIENINSTIIRHLKYLPKMQEFLIPQKGHLQENMSQFWTNLDNVVKKHDTT